MRRRPQLLPDVQVFEPQDNLNLMAFRASEVQKLRQTEQAHAVLNQIGDFVVYLIQNEPDPDRVRISVYDAALRRFGDRVQPNLIKRMVDGVFVREQMVREEAVEARAAAKRKKSDVCR